MAEPTQTDLQFLSSDPEVLGLQRQRQLASLLTGQAFNQPQGQMISGHYVKPSALQQALPMINAAIGGLTNANLDTKQTELAAALRGKQQQAIQQYMSATNPQEQFAAGTSQYAPAQLQASAYKMLEPITAKKDEIIQQRNFGPGGGMSTILEGQQSIPSGMESAQIALGLPRNPATWNPQQRAAAAQYEVNLKTAGAGRTVTNVQNQLPFKEQIQKEAASGLMKNFETLQNVPSALANMDKMVALSKQPIYAGVGGETKLQIAKLFNNNFGTNISPETVKNTEEFKSAAYMGIMDNLKKTDSNPTMAQQNALKEAIGSLGTDPAAIPRVVNVMRDVLVNKAMQHNSLVQQTMQNGVQYPYSIEVPLPKAAPAPNGNVRSLADEILGRK
jgi:hypothetical protein